MQSCPTLCNPMDCIACQAPLCMEFSRQEYWSGLPLSSLGDLPDTGIELTSFMSPALAGRFFTTSATHEIKRHLLFGRKVMTNLDSILKNRDITLLKNVCIAKTMIFPVVIYRCESWTMKKAECQRIDAFMLWHWRRLLRITWTTRRSNQSILK